MQCATWSPATVVSSRQSAQIEKCVIPDFCHHCRYLGFSNDVQLHELKAARDGWRDAPMMISEKAAIESRRMPGVTVLTRCNCKGFCNARYCPYKMQL